MAWHIKVTIWIHVTPCLSTSGLSSQMYLKTIYENNVYNTEHDYIVNRPFSISLRHPDESYDTEEDEDWESYYDQMELTMQRFLPTASPAWVVHT